MHENDILAVIVYFVSPIIGLGFFLWLRKKIKNEKISAPLIFSLFMIFFIYGGLMQIILTSFFLQWSGLASLGMFFLIFIAPVIMLINAFVQFKLKDISQYHKWAFLLSSLYFIIAPLVIVVLFFTAKG